MTTLLSELTASGLVLWRLRWSSDHHIWCTVQDRNGELILTVHEPATDRIVMTETHDDIGPVVDRARHLCDQYMANGWQCIDIDLDEPD